jgi:alpha-L-fucosidase
MILTAKHHDGFCLFDTQYTAHNVMHSPFGRDVVALAAQACREEGIAFGVYLSPWDRNAACYGDSPAYNAYFKAQLRELLTNYGPIDEVWFDGACGEGPNGRRQEYDWQGFYDVVRECQPQALIAISGPDIRWVGNEDGFAGEEQWSVALRDGVPVWYPAECDVSIRPGWFYHASEDDRVKSLAHLWDIYCRSVGSNAVLLLNVPPDRRGLIHENDAARLRQWRGYIDSVFVRNLICGASEDGEASVRAGEPFNLIELTEDIARGQSVAAFTLQARSGGLWRTFYNGKTIGCKKLCRIPDTTADAVRLVVDEALGGHTACLRGVFYAPPIAD